MPKNTKQRIIDRARPGDGATAASVSGGGTGAAVTPHAHSFSALTGTATTTQVPWAALETVLLTAGNGLTGGGTLEANRTFAVGAGDGITVAANDVSLASTTAGAGLTYTTGVLAVGAGNGITVAADSVALATSTAGAGLTYTTGVLAVGAGDGISVAADAVAVDGTVVRTSRTLTAGDGLTGGGTLAADRTFTLGTPSTLTVNTTNALTSTSHTHAITTSSNPGAAAAILASTAGGGLTLVNVVATAAVTTPRLAAAGTLTIDAAGDVIDIGASNTLKTANYASQATGWGITYAGAADFRYLFSDELHAKSFIADLEQALAGGQIICKSVAMLGAAFTVPAASGTATLTVRDLPSAPNMAVFEANDIVRLRTFSRAAGTLTISDCWGVVTAYADQADGLQTWTFTRSAAPNAGAITASTVIAVDSIVLDYGVTGNGTHEINAIDGAYGLNSPYSQVKTWATHPATGETVRTRIGNLRGLFSVANEYGLYAGNGVTDASSFIRLSSYTNRLNNLPMEWWSGGVKTIDILSSTGISLYSSGATLLNLTAADGIKIEAAATVSDLRSYGFKSGVLNAGGLYGYSDGTYGHGIHMLAYDRGVGEPEILIQAYGNTSRAGHVYLSAKNSNAAPLINLLGSTTTNGTITITSTLVNMTAELNLTGNLDVTGIVIVPYGSAAAPTYSFNTDENTGMYDVADNNIGWATGGALAMKLSPTSLMLGSTADSILRLRTPASNSVAVNGTLTINAAFTGIIFMLCPSDSSVAIFGCDSGTAYEISDPEGLWSATKDTASSNNVYVELGNLIVQNKRASTRLYHIMCFGTSGAFA